LSTRLGEKSWVVEARKTAMTAGERLALPAGGTCTFLEPYRRSWRLWRARVHVPEPVFAYLQRWGKPIAYPLREAAVAARDVPDGVRRPTRIGGDAVGRAGVQRRRDQGALAKGRADDADRPTHGGIEPRERRATIRRVVRGLPRHGGRNKGCTGKRRQ